MSDTLLDGWTPRPLPTMEPLEGTWVTLVPTDVARDADRLHEVTRAGDPALWDYLPYGPFASEVAFEQWLVTHVSTPGLQVETVLDRASGEPGGLASFMRMEPVYGVIEIGHIFFGAALQRTPATTEAIFLMLRHLFDDLGYRRVEWKCDAGNARSMRAAERLGFRHEGVFRQHLIVRGRNRDTAWFSIIDGEWPQVRAAFEAWLSPDNFDTDDNDRQLRRLEDIRAGSR
jgi:RimJ/RimL family protein N-acetyltransferase